MSKLKISHQKFCELCLCGIPLGLLKSFIHLWFFFQALCMDCNTCCNLRLILLIIFLALSPKSFLCVFFFGFLLLLIAAIYLLLQNNKWQNPFKHIVKVRKRQVTLSEHGVIIIRIRRYSEVKPYIQHKSVPSLTIC